MKTTRVVSALLTALLLAGPFVTLAAAQQPTQPAPPAAQPPAPDLFQETLRAERSTTRPRGIYDAEAVVANVFLVPGRAITCLAGGIVGVAVLAATLGTGYRPAAAALHEGCDGKWVVSGEDMQPETASGRPTNLYMEQR